MSDIDVLIIGAGPTGLTLALELSLQNIPFRIVDKEPTRSNQSRALVLHSRSQELLHRHGITENLVKCGQVNRGARFFVNKNPIADVDLQNLGFDDTLFSKIFFISQSETERLLDEALLRHGKTVERAVTVSKVVQDDEGVTVFLRRNSIADNNGDNREEDADVEKLRCRYVVGCDGAHSIVRRSAYLTFDGGEYNEEFLLADLKISDTDGESPFDRLTVCMAKGVLVTFPMNEDGLVRLVVSRPERAGAGSHEEEPDLEDIQNAFNAMAPGNGRLCDPVWLTRFRLHHRIVDSYRCNRLFVAGDAAHIHSPAGGQGMNTGIQDSVNLGWKLARVLRGERGDSLLDSYDAERRPIGLHLLTSTDRLFRLAATTNPIFLFLRNLIMPWVIPWAMGDANRRRRAFRFVSQLGIRYRGSPIVGTASSWRGTLRGGDRAPDGALRTDPEEQGGRDTTLLGICSGPTHHLLLFTGTKSSAVDIEELRITAGSFLVDEGSWVEVIQILADESYAAKPKIGVVAFDMDGKLHGLYGFEAPGYVLMRPDGHVAHIGNLTAIDELKSFLKVA